MKKIIRLSQSKKTTVEKLKEQLNNLLRTEVNLAAKIDSRLSNVISPGEFASLCQATAAEAQLVIDKIKRELRVTELARNALAAEEALPGQLEILRRKLASLEREKLETDHFLTQARLEMGSPVSRLMPWLAIVLASAEGILLYGTLTIGFGFWLALSASIAAGLVVYSGHVLAAWIRRAADRKIRRNRVLAVTVGVALFFAAASLVRYISFSSAVSLDPDSANGGGAAVAVTSIIFSVISILLFVLSLVLTYVYGQTARQRAAAKEVSCFQRLQKRLDREIADCHRECDELPESVASKKENVREVYGELQSSIRECRSMVAAALSSYKERYRQLRGITPDFFLQPVSVDLNEDIFWTLENMHV